MCGMHLDRESWNCRSLGKLEIAFAGRLRIY